MYSSVISPLMVARLRSIGAPTIRLRSSTRPRRIGSIKRIKQSPSYMPRRCLARGPPAVDQDSSPADKGGLGAAEKTDHASDVLGSTDASEWDPPQCARELFRLGQPGLGHRGADRARGDRIDPNAEWPQFQGRVLGQHLDSSLGGTIMGGLSQRYPGGNAREVNNRASCSQAPGRRPRTEKAPGGVD